MCRSQYILPRTYLFRVFGLQICSFNIEKKSNHRPRAKSSFSVVMMIRGFLLVFFHIFVLYHTLNTESCIVWIIVWIRSWIRTDFMQWTLTTLPLFQVVPLNSCFRKLTQDMCHSNEKLKNMGFFHSFPFSSLCKYKNSCKQLFSCWKRTMRKENQLKNVIFL